MISTDIEIFLGLDLGTTDHWACAVTKDGTKFWNRTLPNHEAKLTAAYEELRGRGTVLVVVDQPAAIGALAVAVPVAQHLDISVAYLPGLSMRRIADMYRRTAKTDETEATLGMLTGFNPDLARQITQNSNRIRGLFTQIHPPLERILGPCLEHDAVLELLAAWPTPAASKHAGQARIDTKLKKHSARRHTAWASAIINALNEQTVVVDVSEHLEAMVEAHPLYPLLMSMPGVAIRTDAIFIAENSGKTFANRSALATYAGLAPTTRQSGTSIKSERVSHSGN